MTVDSGTSDLRAEKTRDEEKSLTPEATPNGSRPEKEVGDGIVKLTDSDPSAPEAKRAVTGLKVC
jgi:hypothetical protein